MHALLGLTNWSFPLYLSSPKRPLKDSDTYNGNSSIRLSQSRSLLIEWTWHELTLVRADDLHLDQECYPETEVKVLC